MEPLVIVAIVVLFSVLDAIARKQRQAGEGDGGATSPPETGPTTPSEEPRSYDDAVEAEAPSRSTGPTSSEELLPADLWEEIRRLARGTAPTVPAPTQRAPTRPGPPAGPRRPRPARGTRHGEPRPAPAPAPEHPVHRSHAQMGRPLAERRTPLDRPAQGPHPGADVLAVRRMLTGGGPSALRRAVILEEVLGPPAALRGDPYEPGG